MALGSRVVSEQMQVIIQRPDIDLYISVELLDELTETLAKRRLQKYLTQERTQSLFDLIWLKAKLIQVSSADSHCRDPKDDFIINLAIEAKAQLIITGDDDLLVLNPIDKIEVLTLSEVIQRF
ncbi:putative toxin-antitoxin system toxin component, PIN family [Fibrella sp. HMF5405]|uniref:Toxin-antitoxin system toxin component, PIN family n=2 Tax=Fibrella forsythiae TaxID=2817061 RepID=A0ABS3JFW0_9BACT|nr:putative toxin-antitoxin system toxin component, PIN family [Fibrella forsythiae]